MSINGINSVAFKGKISKTKKNNDYERTDAMKKYYPLIAVGSACTSLLFIKDGNVKASVSAIKAAVQKNPGKVLGNLGLQLLDSAGWGLVFGAITDEIINKVRRDDADKAVEQGGQAKKTNKGKIIGSSIGIGFAALAVAIKKQMITLPEMIKEAGFSKNKAASTFAIGAAVYTGVGFYIDSMINKTRAKTK